MKRAGIIGLGVISKYYKAGLEASPFLELVSVCDLCEDAPSRAVYSHLSFYTDFINMIEQEKLEYVIISTNPAAHYEIARRCIQMGVSVILEKPAVTDMEQYDELLRLSKEKGVVFDVMYHFQRAAEMIEFEKRFDPGRISSVKIDIMDPYSSDGKSIIPERRNMGGAWLDSGVNALSVLKCWLAFDKVELLECKAERCSETSEPIFVKAELLIDGVRVGISVDWRQGINYKVSNLVYDGKPMTVNSSEQKIRYDGKEYDCSGMQRLQAHYYGYFKNFKGESDGQGSRKINELLLFINRAL